MDISWTELVFSVEAKNAGVAEGITARFTKLGLYIEDYSNMEFVLPLVGAADYIDAELAARDRAHARIHVYVEAKEAPQEIATAISGALEAAGIAFSLESFGMEEQDWENDWRRFHRPQRVGERLVLCPSWEHFDRRPDDILLVLDPGGAFGSGRDETTRLCLRLLDKRIVGDERVLDLGCGSGVLAVAALLLGAKTALGVDIDPNAPPIARENAERNGVLEHFSVLHGNILTDGSIYAALAEEYDLICANIVADVHLAMRDVYAEKLRSGGGLLLSGIIDDRVEQVRAALEASGFALTDAEEENGWHALAFIKE